MITRPLDLASRLRPEPRSYDWLFYVNAGLLVLFFGVFGSRYVLSPGLGVDFELPRIAGADANARITTHVIAVVNAGQILAGDGYRSVDQLQDWLNEKARAERHPALLVQVGADVPAGLLTRIVGMAQSAGFTVTIATRERAAEGPAAAVP